MTRTPLKVGDKWHIKLPGATALSTVEIMEVTTATVLFKAEGYSPTSTYCRYDRYDVQFVEKVKTPKE